ncbi:TauD/TfdA family dioxygenase [Pseudohaliea sp.]|uniref:TauD/TfdA dioxygenase family protein n=1 Tax=Pseudohaliea sp. TaxID=2740289 RepID=UPI0032EE094E
MNSKEQEAMTMPFDLTPSGQACGATVRGLDLAQPLDAATVAALRAAWLEHGVLAFPDQAMGDDDLERFTRYFGPFGDDPFIEPIPGREHIIAVSRRADEQAPLFAENWHTDWSFQATPPAGTCLLGITIPPSGGDTLFADQRAAWASLPDALRERLRPLRAIHSARGGYAPEGVYGEADQAGDRSMAIRPSAEALATRVHPLVREHPETGVELLYGCLGYVIGFEGMAEDEALELLLEMLDWQTREAVQYRHEWQPGTLLMWDNRSVLHRATGGYEGHDRLLHRTTIGASR